MIRYPPVIDESQKIIRVDDDIITIHAKIKEIEIEGHIDGDEIIKFGGGNGFFRIPVKKLFSKDQKRNLRWKTNNLGKIAHDREYNKLRSSVIAGYTNFNNK